ncbi:HalOD1 output domain-containing protein [Halomarina oriensis]|uniref:Halobacterial output domain-containing protein n=1 Tax=Halomarina oriensis TaxID=671145 RepID=A0A6B0GGI5_9EURY|nr:HalOD1 output domain-containing protein [Halomarina oriensis]MWG33640.1 hypothetical protein [Halomarina oriensis]
MKRESGPSRSPAERADRPLRYRSEADPAGGRSLLRTVSEGLADLLDEDPASLEPPLATVAAWDALERLLTEHGGDGPSPIHYIEFEYDRFSVAVYGDGTVCIYDAE